MNPVLEFPKPSPSRDLAAEDTLLVQRAADIHEVLHAWLEEHYPDEDPAVLATAVTYELGEQAARYVQDATPEAITNALDKICEGLRKHVEAIK